MKSIGIQLVDSVDGIDSIDLKVDVKRDLNGLITQGLCVGDILQQNQAVILIAKPGQFMFSPTIGVAIDELLLDDDYLRFRTRIRNHYAKDGLIVRSVQLDAGKPLLIDSKYE